MSLFLFFSSFLFSLFEACKLFALCTQLPSLMAQHVRAACAVLVFHFPLSLFRRDNIQYHQLQQYAWSSRQYSRVDHAGFCCGGEEKHRRRRGTTTSGSDESHVTGRHARHVTRGRVATHLDGLSLSHMVVQYEIFYFCEGRCEIFYAAKWIPNFVVESCGAWSGDPLR